MEPSPEMSAEARELMALRDAVRKAGAFSLVANLPSLVDKVAAYVQRTELRIFALEQSARALAEVAMANHYGRAGFMPTDQLRTIATAARDEVTLRALDAEEKRRGT
jgi:hypothetical protein